MTTTWNESKHTESNETNELQRTNGKIRFVCKTKNMDDKSSSILVH